MSRQFKLCVPNIPDTVEEMQNFKFEDHIVPRGTDIISEVFERGFLEDCIHAAIKLSCK